MKYSTFSAVNSRNAKIRLLKKTLKDAKTFVPASMMRRIAEAINPHRYYSFRVIRTPEEAVKALVVGVRHEYGLHSDVGTETSAKVVCGRVKFGKIDEEYSYISGESSGEFLEPEFDINRPFAIFQDIYSWRDVEGDNMNGEQTEYAIVVYVPSVMVSEERFMAEKEAELQELCDLEA